MATIIFNEWLVCCRCLELVSMRKRYIREWSQNYIGGHFVSRHFYDTSGIWRFLRILSRFCIEWEYKHIHSDLLSVCTCSEFYGP